MIRVMTLLARADRGQELIEYAMLVTVISLAGIAGVRALEMAMAAVFSAIALQLH